MMMQVKVFMKSCEDAGGVKSCGDAGGGFL